MRKFNLIYLVIAFALTSVPAYSQFTEVYGSDDAMYFQGLELYQQSQYRAAKEMFEKYLAQDGDNLHFDEEAIYFVAASMFELRDKNAERALQTYIKQHPYSTYRSDVYFMSGVFDVEKKKYGLACKNFKKVKPAELIAEHTNQYYFYYAYALLEQTIKSGDSEDNKKSKGKSSKKSSSKKKSNTKQTSGRPDIAKAMGFFDKLRGKNNQYALQSQYYYAYCNYLEQDYSKALPEFLKIEDTEEYKNIVPYYIIQIYYAQGKFDEVYDRAENLLRNNPQNENNPEIHRILGEIYYTDKSYQKAAYHLDAYQAKEIKPLRADIYELGMAYYQTGEYKKAIEFLQKVTSKEDAMTENAYLHLGNSYAKLGDKTNAGMAFSAACKTNFDPQIHEEARFNHALTTYESVVGFSESATSFTNFINDYPNSVHTPQAIELLTEVLMSSQNYKEAVKALNKLNNPSKEMLETHTYLLYQIGLEAYTQNHLSEAIDTFTSVIESTTANAPKYRTDSYYWRAESQYKLRRYNKAADDLTSFFEQPNVNKSRYYLPAFYSAGYANFSQKNYADARTYFLKYTETANKKDPTYADALNRIGDCYFSQREFVNAEKYYARVIATGASGADYATFQRGYALGLLKRYNDKINVLEKLVSNYPKSEFADDALYEIARAYLNKNDATGAIKSYDLLISKYPKSPLTRKAALEKGMTYANQGDYRNAITAYKAVIDKYPKTEEAYSALDGLEAAYIETNSIKEFSDYAKDLNKKGMNVTAVKEDSLTYVAAERQYMSGNYPKAIEGLSEYVKNYCDGGRYCSMARYYLADSYYRTDKMSDALVHYGTLAQTDGNPYIEEACIRAADISYDQKKFGESIKYFKKLQEVATNTEKLNAARLGVLRCSNHLGDNQTSIDIATEILNDPQTSAEVKSEATYNRMKAFLATGKNDEALPDLRTTAQNMRTEQGAEAKYLLAKYYFDKGDSNSAEQQIVEFAGSNTPYPYWLAKSFILLADINIKKGDDFQAKQYLKSLQSNYTEQNEIQQEINERLADIETRLKDEIKESGIL